MSVDTLSAIAIFVIGAVGTIYNVSLTRGIRADIAELKVWALERFVAKDDMKSYFPGWAREAIQLRGSRERKER